MRGVGGFVVLCGVLSAALPGMAAGPWVPPPPILEDEDAGRDRLDGDDDEPARRQPRRLDLDEPSAADEPAGAVAGDWGLWETVAAQLGSGLGAAAGLAVLTTATLVGLVLCGSSALGSQLASFVACGVLCLPLFVGPGLIGAVETWVANTLTGQDKSSVLPIAAAYGGLVLGGIGAVATGALLLTVGSGFLGGGCAGTACVAAGCAGTALVLTTPVIALPAVAWGAMENPRREPTARPPGWDDVGREPEMPF